MTKRSYLTTPLYYVNARPHLGHSYTTIVADVMKRYRLQRGEEVVFLTGTDEHGEKIEQMAKTQGRPVSEFVDEVAADFRATWEKMGISFDIFYRTTQLDHVAKVKQALQTLKDKGEIVFREYEGLYCVGCERFLTESELTDKGLCPDHEKKPEPRKEANYFFLMSKYQGAILSHIEKHPEYIQPEHFKNEMLSFLKQPLGDLCISRPKFRLTWGIELPFDANYVTYVWFDALLNYLCATGWPSKFDQALWSECTHLIGKDILKTHAIYWTAMLLALDVKPPKNLQVGGYWLMDGSKMSKSLGNVVRPLEIEEKFGRDTLRFFLLREMSYGLDATFSIEGYVNCVNAYLANGMGNLVSRVLTLCQKNFKGSFSEASLTEADHKALEKRAQTQSAWDKGFDELKFQNSLKAWSELVTHVDLYVNDMKPWALAKDPAQAVRLQTVLGICLQLIQTLAVLIYPVLPHASRETLQAIGVAGDPAKRVDLALENRFEYRVSQTVPKLFMRVQAPSD
ncbi:methionine--tRNA ligase [Bdellovibrionota bacterium FG-2]